MPVLAFINPAHSDHNPPAEFLHGKLVPYYEMPARADTIQQALLEANLISVIIPENMLVSAVCETHNAEMVRYLQVLSEGSKRIIQEDFSIYDINRPEHTYYYENIFPAQMLGNMGLVNAQKRFIYDSTSPVGTGTWQAALGSASAAYAGAQAILAGEMYAYALCRPPGHHAGFDSMGGYCYLNNAAIAATALKARGRVAILDIDYHHGNGTQDIFWQDDAVLYVSLHADPAVDYPYYTGYVAENRETTINYPLAHGTDSCDYLKTLDEALLAIHDFAPTTLVVSVGFDIYKDDPMGHFTLDEDAFASIGQRIASLGLPTLYVQEGGYRINKLGDLAVHFFRGVMSHAT